VAGREISAADNARSEHPIINGRKNLKMPPKDSYDQHPYIYLPTPLSRQARAKRNRKAKERTKEK